MADYRPNEELYFAKKTKRTVIPYFSILRFLQMKNFLKYTERLLFFGALGVSLFFIITVRYNPSLDGPAHMYNARLINYIIAGNNTVNTFHTLNKAPLPNLTGHYILAFFNTFLSSAASVKILLTLYIVFFSLGFRAILKLMRPENIGLSAFAIPFAHSSLYYVGFYNFCISAALMLWALFYYLKHLYNIEARYTPLKSAVMLLLLLALYFTNGLAFVVLGLVLLAFELQILFPYLKKHPYRQNKKIIHKHFIMLGLVWLPGIICLAIFMAGNRISTPGMVSRLTFSELCSKLFNAGPLVAFMQNENNYTRIFTYIIILLFAASVFYSLKKGKEQGPATKFALPVSAGILLLLYFIIPDGTSVGMMSVRFCYYFLLIVILWLGLRKNYVLAVWLAMPLIYFLHFFLLIDMHAPIINALDKAATEIVEAEDHIAPNSIVMPVNCSSNWLMIHFTDYDGLKKPVINTADYESEVGWFPVKWKQGMPAFSLHGQTTIPNALYYPDAHQQGSKEIDYIFVFGDMSWITQRPYFAQLKSDIESYCKPVFISKDGYIHLYSVNH